jgi:hypothetical protein
LKQHVANLHSCPKLDSLLAMGWAGAAIEPGAVFAAQIF